MAENLTVAELCEMSYADRNNGRNFVTTLEGEPRNLLIHSLTARGFFQDGGPSASGRWRDLTALGRAQSRIAAPYTSRIVPQKGS
jgi:hypothetical protein